MGGNGRKRLLIAFWLVWTALWLYLSDFSGYLLARHDAALAETSLQKAVAQQRLLQAEIQELQTHPKAYEVLARSRLDMRYPNEVVIAVEKQNHGL